MIEKKEVRINEEGEIEAHGFQLIQMNKYRSRYPDWIEWNRVEEIINNPDFDEWKHYTIAKNVPANR